MEVMLSQTTCNINFHRILVLHLMHSLCITGLQLWILVISSVWLKQRQLASTWGKSNPQALRALNFFLVSALGITKHFTQGLIDSSVKKGTKDGKQWNGKAYSHSAGSQNLLYYFQCIGFSYEGSQQPLLIFLLPESERLEQCKYSIEIVWSQVDVCALQEASHESKRSCVTSPSLLANTWHIKV